VFGLLKNHDFLKKQEHLYISNSSFLSDSCIKWNFQRIKSFKLPFYFYKCEMSGWENHANGFGYDRNELLAIVKSFNEAWERICLQSVVRSPDFGKQIVDSSNGFAAGSTNQMAIENSLQELIERAAVVLSWQEMKSWEKTKCIASFYRLSSFCMYLLGWRLHLFDISTNLGLVKAILGIHNEFGAVFDSSFADKAKAVEDNLIMSICRQIDSRKKSLRHEFPFFGIPSDHSFFYSNPNNLTAFDHLLHPKENPQSFFLEHENSIQTQLLVPVSDFPAVAMSFNEKWPRLKWGMQSIKGINPWPHPIA